MKNFPKGFLLSALCLLSSLSVFANGADTLLKNFQQPPATAKPKVWWHWMDGNVSREGIDKDLAWMARQGVGGVQIFDVALSTPQIVEKKLAYRSPEWWQTFRHAVKKANKLGLDVAITASPGWSETGGPWVDPAQAMKKMVWSETRLTGGVAFSGHLPPPPDNAGPFQDIPANTEMFVHPDHKPAPDFYRDSAVIAFKLPAAAKALPTPIIETSAPLADPGRLLDNTLDAATDLPFGDRDNPAWLQYRYPQKVKVSSVSLAMLMPALPPGGKPDHSVVLLAGDSLASLEAVTEIPLTAPQNTRSFAPVEAKIFRLVFRQKGKPRGLFGKPAPTHHRVAGFTLHSELLIDRFEEKAGFAVAEKIAQMPPLNLAPKTLIARQDVLDISERMGPDGYLEWTPPEGDWLVLRIGYSLTGRMNGPATAEATGLEVDKLNHAHVKAYLKNYLAGFDKYLADKHLAGGIAAMVVDSYEAGAQNWTDNILPQFKNKIGYDPAPWLPVLTGRIVGSVQESEAFLWDFRELLGELIADNHYRQIAETLHQRKMLMFGEGHESHRAFIGDGMEAKKSADIPMAAMWVNRPPEVFDADIKESSSVANLYGKQRVAAESFTAFGNSYGFAPEDLKPTADRMLSMGLNQFVIHSSAHQPRDDIKPGVGLGPFGQWFTRHETWAELTQPWLTYLARSSYLLQQGKQVTDIAYLYPQDTNISEHFKTGLPAIPAGYSFDFVNAGALDKLLANGKPRYRVLVVDPAYTFMPLAVLHKLRDLAQAGLIIVSEKPHESPSLADRSKNYSALIRELWGEQERLTKHKLGKGYIYNGGNLSTVLHEQGIVEDVQFAGEAFPFVHRRMANTDIYFINNRENKAKVLRADFRASGFHSNDKTPEIWRADSGAVTTPTYTISDNSTRVELELGPYESLFVVFREKAAKKQYKAPSMHVVDAHKLAGPWHVSFPKVGGDAIEVLMRDLILWTASSLPEVRYYSGTAVYRSEFSVEPAWLNNGERLTLDLGAVKNLAKVTVNGKPLGILWKPPFAVNVGSAVKPGINRLEISITNLWPNRMIGDKQPGVESAYTKSTYDPFNANSPLLPSGLLGPVELVRYHMR